MHNLSKWAHTWLGALAGVAAGLLCLVSVTVSQAATEPLKGQAVEKPVQGQQLCPATPGAGPCKVVLDCPAVKAPGKTTCQATIDCPPVKPVKPKKKPKSE
ncbi:MAG: hypothetical protein WCD80_01055 [Desulfobaccales bacterium]